MAIHERLQLETKDDIFPEHLEAVVPVACFNKFESKYAEKESLTL
jgi:hypothetical protein